MLNREVAMSVDAINTVATSPRRGIRKLYPSPNSRHMDPATKLATEVVLTYEPVGDSLSRTKKAKAGLLLVRVSYPDSGRSD
jgi:hypothetical protein